MVIRCVSAGTKVNTVDLLSGKQNDQTVFAHTYVTSGADGSQEIYGNDRWQCFDLRRQHARL
jgi:hypothetical protein